MADQSQVSIFSAREQQLLCKAFLCMKSSPQIDYGLLAGLTGYTNKVACSNAFRTAMRKVVPDWSSATISAASTSSLVPGAAITAAVANGELPPATPRRRRSVKNAKNGSEESNKVNSNKKKTANGKKNEESKLKLKQEQGSGDNEEENLQDSVRLETGTDRQDVVTDNSNRNNYTDSQAHDDESASKASEIKQEANEGEHSNEQPQQQQEHKRARSCEGEDGEDGEHGDGDNGKADKKKGANASPKRARKIPG